MDTSGSDRDRRAFDRRDIELERLRRECDELRIRERRARAEADSSKESLARLMSASQRFTSSMRGRIDERQRSRQRLSAQNAIGRVLAEAEGLDEALPKVLRTLGESFGGLLAVYWAVDEQAGMLRFGELWRLPNVPLDRFERACRWATFRRGVDLPGRVWAEGRPVWVEDVLEYEGFRRRREAVAAEGLPRSAFAFTVRGGITFGVIELFRPDVSPLDEEMYETMLPMGAQIGQFADRWRVEGERQRLARESETARARLEAILQQLPAGAFISNPSGRFVLVNEGAEDIYRTRIRSIEDCARHALSYPEGRELSPEEYPLNRALAGESVSDMEHYVLRGDGTRAVVSANAAPVRDDEGNIVAAVKTFRDVTELREAEEALRGSEERVREILASIDDGFSAFDRQWRHVYVNERVVELAHMPREELLGKTLWEVHPEMARGEPYTEMRRAMEERVFVQFEHYYPRYGRWLYRRVYPSEGGLSVYTTDVTEHKKAQEERERLLAREWRARAEAEERKRISRDLHDRVAHSMAVVHQSLELYEALKEHAPSQAEARLELAREMAREALDSTRGLSAELRRAEVGDSLSSALSNLLQTTVPPGVECSVSVEGDESLVPPQVREQLFLVLREGIRNAVSHSEAGNLAVEVNVGQNEVVGRVEDDGRGFSPTPNGNGGLRSMRERAGIVGGTFNLSSTPGTGTKIETSIPLRPPRNPIAKGNDG